MSNTNERADLIAELRGSADLLQIGKVEDWGGLAAEILQAADMLEADAQDAFTVGLACQPRQHDLSLDLLERLSKTLINLGYSTPEGGTEHFGAQIESQLYNLCRGVDSILAQQVATPYDQQALELCDKCGWKAIMPGEPCFVCNMKTEAQQVAVPEGYALAMAVLQSSLYQFLDDVERAECDALIAAAQGAKP